MIIDDLDIDGHERRLAAGPGQSASGQDEIDPFDRRTARNFVSNRGLIAVDQRRRHHDNLFDADVLPHRIGRCEKLHLAGRSRRQEDRNK